MILHVLPGEEDGVGPEQNQDSGYPASPLGLAADLFGKSGSILDSPPPVSHSYKEGSRPGLVGVVGASVAGSEV